MTDLPDVAKLSTGWAGDRRASITRGFCFICASFYKYAMPLPISTDSLFYYLKYLVLIFNRLDVTCVSCNILTAILSVIQKSLRK